MMDSITGACPYDPEWDATDGACPAFWRGQTDGVNGAVMRVQEALDATEPIPGILGHSGLESVVRAVESLRADVARLEGERDRLLDYLRGQLSPEQLRVLLMDGIQ